jgi:hypothetical protein
LCGSDKYAQFGAAYADDVMILDTVGLSDGYAIDGGRAGIAQITDEQEAVPLGYLAVAVQNGVIAGKANVALRVRAENNAIHKFRLVPRLLSKDRKNYFLAAPLRLFRRNYCHHRIWRPLVPAQNEPDREPSQDHDDQGHADKRRRCAIPRRDFSWR